MSQTATTPRPVLPLSFVIAGCAVGTAIYLARAWSLRFLQDDAFIFFRYAQNLVDGHGPVWNAGERVEGYTSFLWMLVVSGLLLVHAHVETAVHAVTLGLGLGCLGLVFALTRRLTGARAPAVLALILLATDHSFAVWSTSGMETRLYGFLALSTSWLALRFTDLKTRRSALFLGACAVATSLTRPEGLLVCAAAFGYLGYSCRRGAAPGRLALVALGVWGLGVAAHLAWRHGYYGDWVPNTFHVKAGFDPRMGLVYLFDYVRSFPHHALIVALAAASLWPARDRPFRLYLLGLSAVYVAYLATIGGDFMEFRFLDVLLPSTYVLAADGLSTLASRTEKVWLRRGAAALAIALAGGNVARDLGFERRAHTAVMTRGEMVTTPMPWIVVGKWLRRFAQPGEILAVEAAGAMPYYSGMQAVDMLGLNDREVARQPAVATRHIGHRKLATQEYLERRQVTFVFVAALSAATSPRQNRTGFWVRIDNGDPALFGGHALCVLLRSTLDREVVMRSLRERGAVVFPDRCVESGALASRPSAPDFEGAAADTGPAPRALPPLTARAANTYPPPRRRGEIDERAQNEL